MAHATMALRMDGREQTLRHGSDERERTGGRYSRAHDLESLGMSTLPNFLDAVSFVAHKIFLEHRQTIALEFPGCDSDREDLHAMLL